MFCATLLSAYLNLCSHVGDAGSVINAPCHTGIVVGFVSKSLRLVISAL